MLQQLTSAARLWILNFKLKELYSMPIKSQIATSRELTHRRPIGPESASIYKSNPPGRKTDCSDKCSQDPLRMATIHIYVKGDHHLRL